MSNHIYPKEPPADDIGDPEAAWRFFQEVDSLCGFVIEKRRSLASAEEWAVDAKIDLSASELPRSPLDRNADYALRHKEAEEGRAAAGEKLIRAVDSLSEKMEGPLGIRMDESEAMRFAQGWKTALEYAAEKRWRENES